MATCLESVPRGGIFITGTDTGVGKTMVACAILHRLCRANVRAVGMKPVAAGTVLSGGAAANSDVLALERHGSVSAAREIINPYCFDAPIAPHIAARFAGVRIDLDVIAGRYAALAGLADVVVVEGAGGFCVPIDAASDMGHVAARLNTPVVLVVGVRLGCLNHALLTAAAIRQHGLRLAGWVANTLDADMLRIDENVAALRERLGAPLIARIGHLVEPSVEAAASCFSIDTVKQLFCGPN
jgi:dethiobiotin synthetase